MSLYLYRWGRWAYRARTAVVAAWVVALIATITAASLLGRPAAEGFEVPGTEAQEAMDFLAESFPEASGSAAQAVVLAPEGTAVTAEPLQAAVADAAAELANVAGVLSVSDPFADPTGGDVSPDGRAAIVTVQFTGAAADVPQASLDLVQETFDDLESALPDGTTVALGGDAFSSVDVPHDNLSEVVGLALAFLVLLATFGSFVAAGQPLFTAVIGVGITLGSIELVTSFTDISATAPVLATMLGLAVGIDYALFVLSRHVRQLKDGMDPEESAARAVATAGSAVVFAGLTVVVALVGLVLVGVPFMTVMGLAAAGAVALAVLVSLTLTPALLGFTTPRLVRGIERSRRRRAASAAADAEGRDERPTVVEATRSERFFGRWVRLATVRPVVTIAGVLVAIGLLSVPALDLRLGLPDAGSLDSTSQPRQAYDLVAEHFGPGANGPLLLTGSTEGHGDPVALVGSVAQELAALDGVAAVPVATPDATGSAVLFSVVPDSAPDSEATADLVRSVRDLTAQLEREQGIELSVTGQTAAAIDVSTLLSDALLPYTAFILLISFVLLTMVFRSLWVPLKATVGFLLTIGAALGAVALVYSWGWFAGPLGVEQTGAVISFMPIIVLGVLFGLAMDYEVFLVSTMREEVVHRGGARRSIRAGFVRSAPVVTAAALIMFAVFATFVPAADSTIKPIALALAVGVFVDAFVVRMTFVPAVMQLLGDRAWAMPAWLDRVLPSFDVEGERLGQMLGEGAERVDSTRPETDRVAVG